MGTSPAKKTIAAAASALLVAAVYFWRLDRAAGLMVDDAWYVLLAQALARGEGYAIVNSASAAILPAAPPGFPAILSIVFRFAPQFPDNVPWLKAVSIAAMGVLGVATYWYGTHLRRLPSGTAFGVALVTVLTPAFVFLATSTVMAECVFALTLLLTVIAVEHAAAGSESTATLRTALAALLAVVTILVRSAGAPVALAGFAYFVLRGERRRALLFAVVLAVGLVPWLLYARAHTPTDAEREANGGGFAYSYSALMRMRIGGDPQSGRASVAEVASRVGGNLVNVFARDIGGLVVPALYRPPFESGEEIAALGGRVGLRSGSMGNAGGTIVVSGLLALVMLAGYVSLSRESIGAADLLVPLSIALIVTVPFLTFRYVVPLAPFAFVYLARGLRVLFARSSDPWRAARIALACIVVLDAADHMQYVLAVRNPEQAQRVDWLADARAVQDALVWMRLHVTERGDVATTNPALVYLLTGRKTVAFGSYSEQWDRWKASGVRYLVCLAPADLPPRTRPYTVLFQSAERRYWIIEI